MILWSANCKWLNERFIWDTFPALCFDETTVTVDVDYHGVREPNVYRMKAPFVNKLYSFNNNKLFVPSVSYQVSMVHGG